MANSGFTVSLVNFDPSKDVGNVDVEVEFASGARYGATFFLVENVVGLMNDYQSSGECAGGLYFWASHMIIINELTQRAIEMAVADLIASDEFYTAFGPLTRVDPT